MNIVTRRFTVKTSVNAGVLFFLITLFIIYRICLNVNPIVGIHISGFNFNNLFLEV
jgi:uncharacterized protein HemY